MAKLSTILVSVFLAFSFISVANAQWGAGEDYSGPNAGTGDHGNGYSTGVSGGGGGHGSLSLADQVTPCPGDCVTVHTDSRGRYEYSRTTGTFHYSADGGGNGGGGGGDGYCPPGYRHIEWGDSEHGCEQIYTPPPPPPPPPPTADITLSDQTVLEGDTITIIWSSSNAGTCSGVNFSTGGATSGNADVTPEDTTEYQVLCSSASDSATVTVLHPSLTIVANPESIRRNETSTISWSATNVDSCSVSEDNPDFVDSWSGISGTRTTSAITAETTYTLTCATEVRDVTETAVVNLIPAFEEF